VHTVHEGTIQIKQHGCKHAGSLSAPNTGYQTWLEVGARIAGATP